jgi:hypothetical protein
LLQSECGDCGVVVEFSEMRATRFLDELALVGVDAGFLEEPFDLGAKEYTF